MLPGRRCLFRQRNAIIQFFSGRLGNQMEISVNGDLKTVPERISVGQLVEWLELKKERVAVELNRNIVPRSQWEDAPLKSGDRLEIVHFVGGG